MPKSLTCSSFAAMVYPWLLSPLHGSFMILLRMFTLADPKFRILNFNFLDTP